MIKDTQLDGEVVHEIDLRQSFRKIRENAKQAYVRKDLTELYKRAAYLIMMTHGSPLKEDTSMKLRRVIAEREFGRTVRLINRRAKEVAITADYNEKWDQLEVNGYETQGENLLEPEHH